MTDPRQFGILNLSNVVVAQAPTEAEALDLAAALNAKYPWVEPNTPRGRRWTETIQRRGGQFIVVPPAFLQNWADVEFSR